MNKYIVSALSKIIVFSPLIYKAAKIDHVTSDMNGNLWYGPDYMAVGILTGLSAAIGVFTRAVIGDEDGGILSAMHQMGKVDACILGGTYGVHALLERDAATVTSAAIIAPFVGVGIGAVLALTSLCNAGMNSIVGVTLQLGAIGYGFGAISAIDFMIMDQGIMQPLFGDDDLPFIWETLKVADTGAMSHDTSELNHAHSVDLIVA